MKKITIIVVTFFLVMPAFSQQISDGLAPGIDNYTIPIKSGTYSGINAIGGIPDTSQQWSHLFVIRHGNINTNYQLQIASTILENDRLFFRKIANGGLAASNPSWLELATRGTNTFTGNQSFSGNLVLKNYENIAGKGNKIIFTAYGDDLQGPQIRSYLTFASGDDSRMGLVLSSYSKGYMDELFLIDGKVGIGITNPDEKLTVKGKIHAQEVRIDMNGPLVPDYVFANDYKLKSLQEVEDYIKENKHLPEIPSAKEIEKNGLMLAEMNMRLLKKIEELTIYMIEMKKENEIIKKENQEIKKDILNLKLKQNK